MRTLEEYKQLQQMKKLIGTKVKFITDYMKKGEYNIMTLDKIETNGSEFNEPYFSNKDDDTFCTFDYAVKHRIEAA